MNRTQNRSLVTRLRPTNLQEEKAKFFFDVQYNPQFEYAEHIAPEYLHKHGAISDKFLPQATAILDKVIRKWGTESAYLAEVEGRILERQEVSAIVRKYLKENEVDSVVKLAFTQNIVAPAHLYNNTLSIRVPIAQREHRILGMLHHEIGTHLFRQLNDEKHQWSKHFIKHAEHSYLDTEEGLASLNSHFSLQSRLLWFPALYYYLVHQAHIMSFSELNQDLKKYVDDRERRWNMCVRVKRGIGDTSILGAFAKDQVYLRGIVLVLDWLEKHDYDPTRLYIGKVGCADLERAEHLSPGYAPLLPAFLTQEKSEYIQSLKQLRAENNI